ncbi:MAG: excalibur calcium-binding domain-containing protein [Pseudolabrys sp.]|jgi:hypothetical protein
MIQPPQAPRPDIVHSDIAGAEKRLRDLKDGFRRVSRKWDRRPRAAAPKRAPVPPALPEPASSLFSDAFGKIYRSLRAPVILFISGFGLSWYLLNSPWPVSATLKHLAAFPNCQAAELVGLAPSLKGQPGYWPHNDADADGIACERTKQPLRHFVVPIPL